jgi:hypothetical protein
MGQTWIRSRHHRSDRCSILSMHHSDSPYNTSLARSETSPPLSGAFCQILESMRSEGDIPNGGVLTQGNSPHQGLFLWKLCFPEDRCCSPPFCRIVFWDTSPTNWLGESLTSAWREYLLAPGPRPLRMLSLFPGAYLGKFLKALYMYNSPQTLQNYNYSDCQSLNASHMQHVELQVMYVRRQRKETGDTKLSNNFLAWWWKSIKIFMISRNIENYSYNFLSEGHKCWHIPRWQP